MLYFFITKKDYLNSILFLIFIGWWPTLLKVKGKTKTQAADCDVTFTNFDVSG